MTFVPPHVTRDSFPPFNANRRGENKCVSFHQGEGEKRAITLDKQQNTIKGGGDKSHVLLSCVLFFFFFSDGRGKHGVCQTENRNRREEPPNRTLFPFLAVYSASSYNAKAPSSFLPLSPFYGICKQGMVEVRDSTMAKQQLYQFSFLCILLVCGEEMCFHI